MCVYYMTGAPEGSPKVVLCGFMVFYGEAGNLTCDPCFTRHSSYLLHHGGFFKTTTNSVAFPWVETSTEPRGFMICVFII